MNYYDEIKNKLIDNEAYTRVKDYSKERHKVITYFEIGRLLNEAGGKYGDNIIEEYSKKLVIEVGKKYNRRTLFRMKKFYNVFSNEKVTTMLSQLTWSHYLLLLSLNNYDEIIYYINISKMLKPNDLIPNPIKIKNVNNYENISEKILQRLILEDIPGFLKELGSGFTFVDNEYKVKLSDRYNYVDLLLYNIKYKCYVVVELKITELKKEHTGQIMTYMNYIDKNVKTIDENDTVGIIICKQDNEYVIKYCSDDRIIAREYELV